MALKGPNTEDLRKLHAEVNQITNHRFIVTTLAVTVFGVVLAWVIPKTPPSAGTPVGGFVYAVSIILSLLLFTLFVLQLLLKNTLRLFTSYLVVTEASGWEQDWKKLRKDRVYVAYGKPFTIVFLILNTLCIAMPFILMLIYDLTTDPKLV